MTECNPSTCPGGKKCLNQQFKKRDYSKLPLCCTTSRGWVLKAKMKILQGAFVIEYVGELIDNAELEHLMRLKAEREDKNYYFFNNQWQYI
jgi:[histone H3]-lysine36 N-trimethyltransferase